jgi:hypothetical protein
MAITCVSTAAPSPCAVAVTCVYCRPFTLCHGNHLYVLETFYLVPWQSPVSTADPLPCAMAITCMSTVDPLSCAVAIVCVYCRPLTSCCGIHWLPRCNTLICFYTSTLFLLVTCSFQTNVSAVGYVFPNTHHPWYVIIHVRVKATCVVIWHGTANIKSDAGDQHVSEQDGKTVIL